MKLLMKRLIERARRRLGGSVSERFGVRLEFTPREWWLVYWRWSTPRTWPGLFKPALDRRRLDVWIRLLPFLPVHLSFKGRARPVERPLPAKALALSVPTPGAASPTH